MVSWFYLFIAIALEVLGTVCMKLSGGFERLTPSILMFVFYGLSISATTMALRGIDIGIVYAVWSGVGTAAIVAAGIIYFQEPATVLRLVFIGIIIAGVIGLNLSGSH